MTDVDAVDLTNCAINAEGEVAGILCCSFTTPILSLLNCLSDAIGVIDPESGRLIYANSPLAIWLDRSEGELVGKHVSTFIDIAPQTLSERIAGVVSGTLTDMSFSARLLTGSPSVPVRVRLCRLTWKERQLVGVVFQRSMAETVLDSAPGIERNDPLTGLPDRTFVFSRLEALLHGDRDNDRQFAVLFVDLDNFKVVNDAHGHLAGDRVLREVARRLAGCVRTGDRVARFGGDEFVVLLERVSGRQGIRAVLNRIHAALEKPIAVDDGEVTLTVSVGVAEASREHQSPEDVLSDADRAMYASKRAMESPGDR